MDRPKEIVWFEQLMVGSAALELLRVWLEWPELLGLRGAIVAVSHAVGTVALTLFVSRKRSNLMKWVLIAHLVLGMPWAVELALSNQMRASPLIITLGIALKLAACALLFKRSSTLWLKREPAAA